MAKIGETFSVFRSAKRDTIMFNFLCEKCQNELYPTYLPTFIFTMFSLLGVGRVGR